MKAMRLRQVVGRFLALLAALLACAPAARAQPPAGETAPRPAIWLLEDADTKIYLFGTTHVFPASLRWRSAALDRVIAQADELVMETPDASAAEMEESERLFGPMQMGKAIPILERVSPKARPALLAALQATQVPIETYDRFHTWAVAFLLTGFQIAQNAAQEEGATVSEVELSGAEEQLGAEFRRSKRPISGVETVEEQLGFFASMPQSVQRRFLEMTVMGGDPAAPPTDLIGTAWVRGNVDAIATEMAAMPRELYDVLLTRRNRNWTTWLVRRLEQPGIVLFAVGAGHLAGPDSVQRMLATQGFQARRID